MEVRFLDDFQFPRISTSLIQDKAELLVYFTFFGILLP